MGADDILVIGAGLSGATVARVLAESGHSVLVLEKESHPGGHCHTYRDPATGIMVHAHGPHIMHTDDAEVWAFLERFTTFRPYVHTVQAVVGGQTYPLPITLSTLRQFYRRDFTPEQARAHLAGIGRRYPHAPANFEEQGRSLLGDELYEAFFDGYTRKQWGLDPCCLPASIMRRIPVRFTEDPSYFYHSRAGIPQDGYTAMVARMLDHQRISVRYGATGNAMQADHFLHTIYTGPIDAWFDYRLGRLAYRTLDFELLRARGTIQDVAQVNYCDLSVPWTRITEHKHFTPWEKHENTILSRETSRDCGQDDTPYYPLRLANDESLINQYNSLARQTSGVSFVGRLATYRYLDMDVAVAEALAAAKSIISAIKVGAKPAPFFTAELR